jgi:hypothetical protein
VPPAEEPAAPADPPVDAPPVARPPPVAPAPPPTVDEPALPLAEVLVLPLDPADPEVPFPVPLDPHDALAHGGSMMTAAKINPRSTRINSR